MSTWNDEKLERIIGVVLRTGVVLAAALVLIGGVAYVAGNGQAAPDYRVFHGAAAQLTHLGGIVAGALSLHPLYVIQFGLLLLIATPIARVIICVAGFALERDWTYAIVSLIVLALLLVGIGGHMLHD
jgi:uncharacterized membrane protein